MPIFKIWRLGSKEVSIEEGNSVEEACSKAGWRSEKEVPNARINESDLPHLWFGS